MSTEQRMETTEQRLDPTREPGAGRPLEVRFDSFLGDLHRDPYPTYRWFRENQPFHREPSEDPRAPAQWYVFRYRDVEAALADRKLGKQMPEDRDPGKPRSASEPSGPYYRMVRKWMLLQDPPDHERSRSLLGRAFSPSVAQELRPRIEAITDAVLDRASDAGAMDLIADFAHPLPVTVIIDLLGLDQGDCEIFKEWSRRMVSAIDHWRSPEDVRRADEAAAASDLYFRPILAARRARPTEDLLGRLVSPGERGEVLEDEDLAAVCMMLVFAGHETTMNLIGNGILALLQHPDQLRRLREDPALIDSAVEELLRYDSPVQLTTRVVHEDHELAGRMLRRGERLHLLLGSTNRDPEVFDAPDRLDIGRPDNRHLALGLGIHFCVGAALGRLEGRIAVGSLVRRFPDLRLDGPVPDRRRAVIFRGLTRLPVRL